MSGSLSGKRVIVQGLGNVGYYASSILRDEDDARIIAVIEHDGAVIDENGLDIDALRQHITQTGGVRNFEAAEFVAEGNTILERECDILIPAALEAQITASNAPRINCKLICEAANGPVTFEADELLSKRGVTILPDAYVNAGGVTVSLFRVDP